MSRRTRVGVGAFVLVLSAVFVLYGVSAISYNGDRESGATYVLVAGHHIDADFVGAVALLVALVALGGAVLLLRRQ